MNKWKTLSSKLAFDNPWFKVRQDVVELPDGKIIDDYFMWDEPDVAQIVPITSDGKLVLERQYKHAMSEFMIEFPAGYCNEKETAIEAAKRELLEETGYISEQIHGIGKLSHNPTKELGKLYVFLAPDAKKVSDQNLDTTETIELIYVSPEEVLEKIKSGEIWATGTISSFFLAMERIR